MSPKTCKAAQNAFKVAQEMDQTKIYHGPRPAKVVRVKVPDQTDLLQGQARQTEALFNVVKLGLRLNGNQSKRP